MPAMFNSKFKLILQQLEHHAPFTLLGAASGIIIMFFTRHMGHEAAEKVFYWLHPGHVVLSALTTAAMYQAFKTDGSKSKSGLLPLLFIGYLGSVGIATLSDSLIPYLGEVMLKMPYAHPHVGFIEMWWLVNPAAILGVLLAYFRPSTKFSHTGHVLLSTWASLFHIMMALGDGISVITFVFVFVFLFVAVWLPCCLSDIIFPLLFLGKVEVCSHGPKHKGHSGSHKH